MKNNKNPKNLDGIVKSEDITAKDQTSTNADTKKTAKVSSTKLVKSKKTNFLGQVFAELRKVEWPSFKYVVGWSATIILFTAVIGSVIGFTDYYFESGVKFVDCTSPNGSKNQGVQECVKDLTTSLTFQKYFNRDLVNSAPATANPAQEDANSAISPTLTQPTITSDPAALTAPQNPQDSAPAAEPTPSTK